MNKIKEKIWKLILNEEKVSKEAKERFKEKLKTYKIILHDDEEEVILEKGGTLFGSSGYTAGFRVWIGELEQERLSIFEDQFGYTELVRVKPKKRPVVVSASSWDEIGWEPRVHYQEIHVWL